MKFKLMSIGVVAFTLLLGFSTTADGREPPVAKLVQVEGKVEYSRNGATWRPIRRTKYLFPGYTIRTGGNGSGKLINQQTGQSQDLGSDSVIEIRKDQIALVSGNLSKPETESTSIFDALMNKFAKAQRYTTVRRSVNTGEDVCDAKVRTIRNVTLSPSHPDLVWRNACPEYSYKLVIDDTSYEIPAQATAEMIRFTVSDVKTGEHTYHVEVMDKDGTVYIPRRESTFTWLDAKSEKSIMKDLAKVGDDAFIKADMLEGKGLSVAAMDEYRSYFSENPDDNDMRPLLIQSYQDLKLSNLRESEARLYNAQLEEDF